LGDLRDGRGKKWGGVAQLIDGKEFNYLFFILNHTYSDCAKKCCKVATLTGTKRSACLSILIICIPKTVFEHFALKRPARNFKKIRCFAAIPEGLTQTALNQPAFNVLEGFF
jgi:hypothetical protein